MMNKQPRPIPDGLEIREVMEDMSVMTDKNWTAVLHHPHTGEDERTIQMCLCAEFLYLPEYFDDYDDDYPIGFETGILPHPKDFSEDYLRKQVLSSTGLKGEELEQLIRGRDEDYMILWDVKSWEGFIPINVEQFVASPKADDILSSLGIEIDYLRETVDHGWGEHEVVRFKEWEDAYEYFEQVYPRLASAPMMLIGFVLDRAINRIGTTGWDVLSDQVYNLNERYDTDRLIKRYKDRNGE
jgi:hypothetical protein